MADGTGPEPRPSSENSGANFVCPRCSQSSADEVNRAGSEAEQLATIASTVTLEMSGLLAQLAEIMEGFKQAVENGERGVDGELGNSLGAILRAVVQVKDEMEKVASLATAMSSAKLAQMAESLRLDMRSLMQARNKHRDPV